MKRMTTKVALVCLCAVLISQDALAWGPEARKSIAMAALQLIRREVGESFRGEETSYEADLIRGAEDGYGAIAKHLPVFNRQQAIDAVGYEIQVLRVARVNGAGSHFAYRMGALASLVSQLTLPYGVAFGETDLELQRKIIEDTEAHLGKIRFAPDDIRFHYIESATLYFDRALQFQSDDMFLIRDDYARGRNYRGFLGDATDTYYQRSIESAIDAWYTVFRRESGATDIRPSSRVMAWYYVEELGYLLRVHQNMRFAERAYTLFQTLNPGIKEAHIVIGDMFYALDTPVAKERGVDEWKVAQRMAGEQRAIASNRLSRHYIGEGEHYFKRATAPEGLETDLPDALHAFQLALEYDRTNEIAADRITETSVAIYHRRDLYELQQKFIDSSDVVIKQAERSRLDEDFGAALTSYNQALNLLQLVDTEFDDLYASSKDTISTVKKDVKAVISEVLDAANASIEVGDTAMLASNFDEAIRSYNMVPAIVNVIPAQEGSLNAQRKQDLIDTANTQIEDAKLGKRRADEKKAKPQINL